MKSLLLKALTTVGAFLYTYWEPIGAFIAGWVSKGMVEDNKQLKTKVEGLENDQRQLERFKEIRSRYSGLSDDALRERMRKP